MRLMKACACLAISAALAAALAACSTFKDQPSAGEIGQVGWFETFAAGDYKGVAEIGEALKGCDIGLGTFERIDGEMIVLDGKVYRVAVDGAVSEPPPETKTPFALSVASFSPDAVVFLKPGMGPKELQEALDAASCSAPFAFLAIRAKCKMSKLKLRSVPSAGEPYPPLSKIVAAQNTFEFNEISGTLIGFKTPSCYKGINVPGYHFHFLSDDRKAGGHVLDFKAEDGSVEIETCDRINLRLPSKGWTPPASFQSSPGAQSFHGESAGK